MAKSITTGPRSPAGMPKAYGLVGSTARAPPCGTTWRQSRREPPPNRMVRQPASAPRCTKAPSRPVWSTLARPTAATPSRRARSMATSVANLQAGRGSARPAARAPASTRCARAAHARADRSTSTTAAAGPARWPRCGAVSHCRRGSGRWAGRGAAVPDCGTLCRPAAPARPVAVISAAGVAHAKNFFMCRLQGQGAEHALHERIMENPYALRAMIAGECRGILNSTVNDFSLFRG